MIGTEVETTTTEDMIEGIISERIPMSEIEGGEMTMTTGMTTSMIEEEIGNLQQGTDTIETVATDFLVH